MNRHIGVLSGVMLLAAPSFALAQQGPAAMSGHYADGTGNSMIDRLNASQLNDNYRGPYYHRGEAPPAFRPVQLPPEPPPPIRHPPRHHLHPMSPDRQEVPLPPQPR
ncbi:hypothetical protein [Asaia prunellae]|uniref:hypothetical protein n=1 Tax=Asaia prunellae TaxID=610245 RepID=UPI000685EAD2|nr:hypothetical protein [Asaia prunellae]